MNINEIIKETIDEFLIIETDDNEQKINIINEALEKLQELSNDPYIKYIEEHKEHSQEFALVASVFIIGNNITLQLIQTLTLLKETLSGNVSEGYILEAGSISSLLPWQVRSWNPVRDFHHGFRNGNRIANQLFKRNNKNTTTHNNRTINQNNRVQQNQIQNIRQNRNTQQINNQFNKQNSNKPIIDPNNDFRDDAIKDDFDGNNTKQREYYNDFYDDGKMDDFENTTTNQQDQTKQQDNTNDNDNVNNGEKDNNNNNEIIKTTPIESLYKLVIYINTTFKQNVQKINDLYNSSEDLQKQINPIKHVIVDEFNRCLKLEEITNTLKPLLSNQQ